MDRLKELGNKIHKEYLEKLESLSLEQFEDALIGAIKSGDFMLYVDKSYLINNNENTICQKQGLSYLPNRKVIQLKSQIEYLVCLLRKFLELHDYDSRKEILNAEVLEYFEEMGLI